MPKTNSSASSRAACTCLVAPQLPAAIAYSREQVISHNLTLQLTSRKTYIRCIKVGKKLLKTKRKKANMSKSCSATAPNIVLYPLASLTKPSPLVYAPCTKCVRMRLAASLTKDAPFYQIRCRHEVQCTDSEGEWQPSQKGWQCRSRTFFYGACGKRICLERMSVRGYAHRHRRLSCKEEIF